MTRRNNSDNLQRPVRRTAVIIGASMLFLFLATAQVPLRLDALRPSGESGWLATADGTVAGSMLQANHIVFDPVRDRVYAAVGPGHGPLSNSVVPYFRNARIGEPVPLTGEPNVLAISADGQYLYAGLDSVGAVVRVNLDTMLPEETWLLGNEEPCGRLVATDMVVLEENSHLVAVARKNPCAAGLDHAGVGLYEDGVIRPMITEAIYDNSIIEPAVNPQELIGFGRDSDGRDLSKLMIGADGVNQAQTASDLLSGNAYDIRTVGDHIYASNGDVIDQADLTPLGKFAVANSSLPVVRDGRAYFLQFDQDSGLYELHIFDEATFYFLASTTIAGLIDEQPGNTVEFIDTGPDSMAVRLGDGDVFWLKVKLIQYLHFLPAIGRGDDRHAD